MLFIGISYEEKNTEELLKKQEKNFHSIRVLLEPLLRTDDMVINFGIGEPSLQLLKEKRDLYKNWQKFIQITKQY